MAKISVSIDDELVEGLKREAAGNVSRFVSNAVREAVSRSQMLRGLAELDAEFGSVDPDLRDEIRGLFSDVIAENARMVAVAGTQPQAGSRRKAPSKNAVKLAKRARTGKISPPAASRASSRG